MLPLFLAILALAGDASTHPATAPARKTVAILYFDNNTGRKDYDALGKGMSAMMISDLGAVDEVQLVEREHLQELVDEMERQKTSYFDPATAARVGRMAGAEYVVAGALAAVDPQIRIDSRVIRVETGEIVKTARVTGREDRFFDLQQRLARELMDGLAIALSPEQAERLRARQEANRIDELKTVASYSQALDLFDRKDYAGAAARMVPVVQAAPGSAIVRLTYDEMRKRAKRGAVNRLRDRINKGVRGLP
jgi:TolB-like protein